MFKKYLILAGVSIVGVLPAIAQDAGAPSVGGELMKTMTFFLPLAIVFYFLIIRPQNKQRKQHMDMLDSVRRGDTIVTSGGLVGKVTKVGEQELTVELAENVRVRVMRRMVADVRGKGTLVPANDVKPS